jgi:hypothetical protein
MNVGDKISVDTCVLCPIMRVDGIYSVKWDGNEGCYVICIPEESTHRIMACTDEDGDTMNVIFIKEFEGNNNVIDLL